MSEVSGAAVCVSVQDEELGTARGGVDPDGRALPRDQARAERGELAFGTVDSFLIWHLTGGEVHATDPSNASRTLLYNLHDLAWDPEMLDLFRVPAAVLPEVKASSGVFGHATALSAEHAPPIAGVAGDQQSALFGQQCTAPGMVKNTYGTGCFMLMNTGTEAVASEHRLLTTVAWQIGDETHYALEGSIFMGGATVQWLRDGLGLIANSGDIEKLAGSVDHADGVVIVPAFAGLGTPHWNGHARGAVFGLTRGSTCLLYTSPSPRDLSTSRMPSSA